MSPNIWPISFLPLARSPFREVDLGVIGKEIENAAAVGGYSGLVERLEIFDRPPTSSARRSLFVWRDAIAFPPLTILAAVSRRGNAISPASCALCCAAAAARYAKGQNRPDGRAAGPIGARRRRSHAIADAVKAGDGLILVIDDLAGRRWSLGRLWYRDCRRSKAPHSRVPLRRSGTWSGSAPKARAQPSR